MFPLQLTASVFVTERHWTVLVGSNCWKKSWKYWLETFYSSIYAISFVLVNTLEYTLKRKTRFGVSGKYLLDWINVSCCPQVQAKIELHGCFHNSLSYDKNKVKQCLDIFHLFTERERIVNYPRWSFHSVVQTRMNNIFFRSTRNTFLKRFGGCNRNSTTHTTESTF